MLICLFTLMLMLAVAYAFLHEGVVSSFCMFCNVVLAGVITFNFWEPLADQIEEMVSGGPLNGYEDFASLAILFVVSLGFLRLFSNWALPVNPSLDVRLQMIGGPVIGLFTGYITAGFLTCVMQTLPWHERFMQFDPTIDASVRAVRRWLPPDRVWLAMMHKASKDALSGERVFDVQGTFELRYARFRRYNDSREALQPGGETQP